MDMQLFGTFLRMVSRQSMDAFVAAEKTWTEGLGAVGLQAFIPDRLFPLVFMVLSWSGKMLPCGF